MLKKRADSHTSGARCVGQWFCGRENLGVSLFHFNKILRTKIIGVSNKTPKNQLAIFFINIKRPH